MTAYYNENDPYCAQWLRNLIAAGQIAAGDVDERDIQDVFPNDLRGYAQCHFFAGIGGWSLALKMAGIGDHFPVWTGSCPCQSFSAAGKQRGFADERHLWPSWFHLIKVAKPAVILGEQVANAIRHGWLDLVFADLEAEGYACGASVLPACSVGAPHIRQRLWFVADAEPQHDGRGASGTRRWFEFTNGGSNGELAHGLGARLEIEREQPAWDQCAAVERGGEAGALGLADSKREAPPGGLPGGPSPECSGSFWSEAEWLECRDGKSRPTKPGLFPLASGVSSRVSKLRAIGNSIIPQVACEFIKAVL